MAHYRTKNTLKSLIFYATLLMQISVISNIKGTLNCQTFAVHLIIVDVLRNEISGQCGTCKTVEKVCKKVVVIKVVMLKF